MNEPDFKQILSGGEYDFLRNDEHLGDRVMLLCITGSWGYGTAVEGSDIDLRGVALQRPSDLLGLTEFGQYEDDCTDSVVYGFSKFVRMLLDCNPNCIELLGLPRDKYPLLTPQGSDLLENRRLFISKRAIKSFGGFATAQLRRLQNALARDSLPQSEREKHIMESVQNALDDFNSRTPVPGELRLYIDRAATPGMETEIFIDGDVRRAPLRTFTGMLDTLRSVVRDYEKIARGGLPKDAAHLNKHAMHLLRLLMTGADLLECGDIITRRSEELPLLRRVRAGEFMREDGTFSPEFYDILEQYQRRFNEAAAQTKLPDAPDIARVGALVERINRSALG